MLVLVSLVWLFANQASACDTACKAFEWAYPLWHTANLRYENSLSSKFQFNVLSKRIASLTALTNYSLCNGILCGGIPQPLNPAPVVAPNIDTMYGTAWLDVNQPLLLSVPNPQGRFYSIVTFDVYTNVPAVIPGTDYPNEAATFCFITKGMDPTPCGSPTKIVTVVKYVQLLVRVYSTGEQNNAQCGLEGCEVLAGVTLTIANEASPLPYVDVKNIYNTSLNGVTGCGYHWSENLCGNGATKTQRQAFWDAVCLMLAENPLTFNSSEANYVSQNFKSLGIDYNGCSALNYDLLAATIDPANLSGGYNYVLSQLKTYGVHSENWILIRFYGSWGTDYLGRGLSSFRLHLLNRNQEAVYWSIFTDSRGQTLNGQGNSYKITFKTPVYVDTSNRGFWSITLYDNTFFLINGTNGYRSEDATNVPSEVHVSASCGTGPIPCITAPNGIFGLVLRGYNPLTPLFYPSPDNLPTVTKCASVTQCSSQSQQSYGYQPQPGRYSSSRLLQFNH